MSFLHITDPKKRHEIVEDYLKNQSKRISQTRLTDLNSQKEYTKNAQKDTAKQKQVNIPNHCKIIKHFKDEELKTNGNDQIKKVIQSHIGEGIQFLPGDINGLQIKLDYLLAEYQAGNTSATHNEIVAITDELLRRKQISQEKYKNINHLIQK
jgi:hypothetical protein